MLGVKCVGYLYRRLDTTLTSSESEERELRGQGVLGSGASGGVKRSERQSTLGCAGVKRSRDRAGVPRN